MGSRPSYPVSVRQVAVLLHASFRPRLAATPLRFANTSPPSGCVGDLHPLAIEHARHTTKPAFLGKWVKQCRYEISRANLLRSFDGMQLRQALEIRLASDY